MPIANQAQLKREENEDPIEMPILLTSHYRTYNKMTIITTVVRTKHFSIDHDF